MKKNVKRSVLASAVLGFALCFGAPRAQADLLYDLSPQQMERTARDIADPMSTVTMLIVDVMPNGNIMSFNWDYVPVSYDALTGNYYSGDGALICSPALNESGNWNVVVTDVNTATTKTYVLD